LRANSFFFCLFCCVLAAAIFIGVDAAGHRASGTTRKLGSSSNWIAPRVHRGASVVSLPIAFEPNVGQADPSVQYVGRGANMTVLLRSDGIELAGGYGPDNPAALLKLQFTNRGARERLADFGTDSTTLQRSSHPRRKSGQRASSSSHAHHRTGRRQSRRGGLPSRQPYGLHPDRPPRPRVPRESKPPKERSSSQRSPDRTPPRLNWHPGEQLAGETNYLLGNDPAKWRTHVPHFARAEAPEIAPGVSLLVYGNEHVLEYDLRVAPGADIGNLRVKISGADHKRIDATGDLVLTIAGHEARMKKPVIYEEWRGRELAQPARQAVNGRYELAKDGTVRFVVAAHDPAATLVIDPSLSVAYSSFLGGAGSDSGHSIALDSTGKIYIGGTTTSSTTFIETNGASIGSGGGPSDYFIAKFDPSQTGLNSLVYLTFIGGSGDEEGGALAVDSSGNVAIAGTTTSPDYPVTDSSTLTSSTDGTLVNDAAVTEIDPTGAKLTYSTLFGGNGNEATLSPGGIAMDPSGNIFVAMDTQSTNLTVAPVASTTVAGPFHSTYGGGISDGFLAIFRPVATATAPNLKYCTYLGISAQATVTGVAVDSVGNAYITGYTSNPFDTLVTTNGFQTAYAGDPYDAFVMKILPSGNGPEDLSYGTYLGGAGSDKALAIAVGTELPGTVYVTGSTQSSNFPVTNGATGTVAAYQTSLKGTANAFLAVIPQDPSTGITHLAYSTFLGGSQSDAGQSVWLAAPNRVYLAGVANSWDFPWQFNLQPFTGDTDAFIAELDPTSASSASLILATPLGGTAAPGAKATAIANGIAVDSAQNIYVTGATTAGDFPTAAAFSTGVQLTCASCQQTPPLPDAFLVELTPSATAMPSVSFNVGKVNFGTQPVGSPTVPPQAVAVKNTGDAPLIISSVGLNGANSSDFSVENSMSCTNAPIAPGAICSLEVTFVPSLVGPEGVFLTLTDNVGTGSQSLEVVGAGSGPLAAYSPLSLNFGNVPVGTTPSLYVTLTNAGNQPLLISSILLSGSSLFHPSSGNLSSPPICTVTAGTAGGMLPGATCSIFVQFVPVATGTFQAQINVTDNSQGIAGTVQVIAVTGTAIPAAPVASVTPATLTFATQAVGTTSGTQTVTLTNSGSAPLNLTNLAVTGSNAASFGFYAGGAKACPLPSGAVAAGTDCTILVDFIPQGPGPVTATFSFTDNASGSPQTVALSGTGIASTEVSVTPDSVAFGTQTVGLTSAPVGITLTNTGNAVMAISKIAISPATAVQFAETNNCAATLGPKASCLIDATFSAQQAGSWTATILLTDDAVESPQAIALSGTTIPVSASVTPAGPITFGSQLAGTASAPTTLTVKNTGASPAILKITSASVADSADFGITNNCTAAVPAAGSCTLSVTFNPAAAAAGATCGSTSGAKNTTLSINDNAPGSPQTITLQGSATDYCVDPPGLTTQTVAAGRAAAYQVDLVSFTGFTGSVALTCTDPATASSCTVQPTSATVTGNTPTPIQLNVTTAGSTTSSVKPVLPTRAPPLPPVPVKMFVVALMLIMLWTAASARKWERAAQLAQSVGITTLLAVSLAACFGGSSATTTAGTPTGTYTLTVTATYTPAGSSTTVTRSIPLTLIVQ
jgi:beta-propeller repeat-containing protein/ASPM-SPD-2-Hydin domain-containing protein/HYDIN/CFA65/VesB family protein